MYGLLPETRFEIVVSNAIFESGDFGGGINFKSVGIWSVEELIGEKFFDGTFMYEESDLRLFEVVGIADRDYISIFTYDHVALASLSGQDIGEITKEAYERQMIESGYYKYYIHHENPDEIIELLKLDAIDAIYSAETAINSNEREKSVLLATNLTPLLIIAAGALLIFYFVMRSSMIKRIYEIAVYRALGVRRREIYGSFAIEIIMVTTISSVLGFIIYILINSYLADTPLRQLASSNVDLIITFVGIILVYLGNLIIGLLPMLLLLRKTPSQIISSYDM